MTFYWTFCEVEVKEFWGIHNNPTQLLQRESNTTHARQLLLSVLSLKRIEKWVSLSNLYSKECGECERTCVCMCVCVWEREWGWEWESNTKIDEKTSKPFSSNYRSKRVEDTFVSPFFWRKTEIKGAQYSHHREEGMCICVYVSELTRLRFEVVFWPHRLDMWELHPLHPHMRHSTNDSLSSIVLCLQTVWIVISLPLHTL
jgi:hypothetical protein